MSSRIMRKGFNKLSIYICFAIIIIEVQYYKLSIATKQTEPEIYYVEKPTYIQVPQVVSSNVATYTEEQLYNKYMDKKDKINNKYWYIGYKMMVENFEDKPETIYDYFTDDEIKLMCYTVENEVRGGDFNSKVNVANVILNRFYSEKFEDSLIEVITSPNQFCCVSTSISEDTILAVEYAFQIEDTTNGALFFHSGEKTASFNGAEYIFTDDVNHHFYK